MTILFKYCANGENCGSFTVSEVSVLYILVLCQYDARFI